MKGFLENPFEGFFRKPFEKGCLENPSRRFLEKPFERVFYKTSMKGLFRAPPGVTYLYAADKPLRVFLSTFIFLSVCSSWLSRYVLKIISD